MNKKLRIFAVVLAAWSILAAREARAADKTYVQVPGVPGESTDATHVAWIDAYALSSGISAAGAVSSFGDVSVLKGTDKSSPLLDDAIARGLTYTTVTIEVCRDTSPEQCYYKVELTNAKVTGIDLSGSACVGSGACTPSQTESVSFSYTKIKWTYTPWTGGSPGPQVMKCFDVAARMAC